METAIRPATNQDTEGIAATIREVYEEYGFTWDAEDYMADVHDVETHYFRKGGCFWVCENESGVVGTVGLEVFSPIPGKLGETALTAGRIRICGADCSLERLYVRPSARRRGIGEALTLRCTSEAKALGRTNMELWSDKRLIDAHRLYQRLGARVVGERICHDPDHSPEWGLLLPLV